MKRYRITRPRAPSASVAIFCSVAFLWAITYCQVDAFVPHFGESSHQEASAEHQDETLPTPGHDEANLHCETVQALLAAPKLEVKLHALTTGFVHPGALAPLWADAFREPLRLASGLSPPARAPPPARPFYRTTYANHAPPVRLA